MASFAHNIALRLNLIPRIIGNDHEKTSQFKLIVIEENRGVHCTKQSQDLGLEFSVKILELWPYSPNVNAIINAWKFVSVIFNVYRDILKTDQMEAVR